MRVTSIISAILVFLAGAFSSVAVAQEETGMALTVSAWEEEEVVAANGQTELRRVEAVSIVPGDIVIYTIGYVNRGIAPAENVVIDNPIPEHMIYRGGSAIGLGTTITFSVDGGKNYAAPANLKVKEKDGTVRPARPEDYTHRRWTLTAPVPVGAEGYVEYRAFLE